MTGRKADVIRAAYYAAEAALRLVKPGGDVSCTFFKLGTSHFMIKLSIYNNNLMKILLLCITKDHNQKFDRLQYFPL